MSRRTRTSQPEVSVVIPTLNRLKHLKRAVASVREDTGCAHEIVVVDGGSRDGTRPWLRHGAGANVRAMFERGPAGAVRAFNRGFRAARGKYLMWLNDDAEVLPYAIDNALHFLSVPANRDVGLVAFYHTWDSPRNLSASIEVEGVRYGVYNLRGVLYANFGLGRASLFRRLKYFDEGFRFFGADPDFSLRVWRAGKRVAACPGSLVRHRELRDARKRASLAQAEADNARLFRKWKLPVLPGHGYYLAREKGKKGRKRRSSGR